MITSSSFYIFYTTLEMIWLYLYFYNLGFYTFHSFTDSCHASICIKDIFWQHGHIQTIISVLTFGGRKSCKVQIWRSYFISCVSSFTYTLFCQEYKIFKKWFAVRCPSVVHDTNKFPLLAVTVASLLTARMQISRMPLVFGYTCSSFNQAGDIMVPY